MTDEVRVFDGKVVPAAELPDISARNHYLRDSWLVSLRFKSCSTVINYELTREFMQDHPRYSGMKLPHAFRMAYIDGVFGPPAVKSALLSWLISK